MAGVNDWFCSSMREHRTPTAPTAKVLVVEDEPSLRSMTSGALIEEGGFQVIEAKSADEALEILNARDDIACVFTDVRMPGRLNGVDLTRHVRERFPTLPVIMTSGNLHPSEMLADVPFMTKPYDLQELSRAIRKMIDRLGPESD